ncbi:MAG: hypothetical protein VX435_05720, partial [Planctomycetota bacterium]|nr:hypothetical protein [Planctomycetota bacterium]
LFLVPLFLLAGLYAVNSYAVTLDYSGGTYKGEVSNGVPHGQGTLSTPSGEKIVGEFEEDRTWNGIYYDSDGSVIGKISDGELME